MTFKQIMNIRLDGAKKEVGMLKYSAYQMTVLLRKVYPDEYKHQELLDYIVSTGYEEKRLAVLKANLTRMKNRRVSTGRLI